MSPRRGRRCRGSYVGAGHPRRVRPVHSPTADPTAGGQTGEGAVRSRDAAQTGATGVGRRLPTTDGGQTAGLPVGRGLSASNRRVPVGVGGVPAAARRLPAAAGHLLRAAAAGLLLRPAVRLPVAPGCCISATGRVPTTGATVPTGRGPRAGAAPESRGQAQAAAKQARKTGGRRERQQRECRRSVVR